MTVASELRVLQRVVFPGDDLDVVPLYVETNMERGAAELAAELANEALTGAKAGTVSVPVANAAVGETQSSIRFGADVPGYLTDDAGPRRSALIAEGRRVSFATYFNAFPASYWRRWTTVESVTLRIRLAGRVDDRPVPLHRQGLQPPGGDDQRGLRSCPRRSSAPCRLTRSSTAAGTGSTSSPGRAGPR